LNPFTDETILNRLFDGINVFLDPERPRFLYVTSWPICAFDSTLTESCYPEIGS